MVNENVAFIRAAVDAGVQMIDTAHLYTGGQHSTDQRGPARPSSSLLRVKIEFSVPQSGLGPFGAIRMAAK